MSPLIRVRATGSLALTGYLDREIVASAPITGDFSSAYRFQPRFTPVAGRTYNGTTGLMQGEPFTPNRLVSGNEVLLTEQGSAAANRAALQTILNNIGSDAARVMIPPGMQLGDMILIPNRSYVGVGLTIETAAVKAGTWLASGARVSAAQHALMPTFAFQQGGYGIANPHGNPETRTVFSLEGSATNVRLRGLRLGYDPTWAATLPDLIPVSGGSAGTATAGCRSGLISSMVGVTTALGVPSKISIEQCWIEGAESKPLLRGCWINGDELLYEGCWMDNIHYRGNDSQCILATDYGRKVVIRNNYMAQSYGESVMAGGGITTSAATIPQDWLVELNLFDNPARFVSKGYDQKNLLEWKSMMRSEVSRNRFRGYRGTGYDSQYYAIVMKCVSQTGPDIWNITRDCTFRMNEIENCRAFLAIAGDGGVTTEGTNRIEIAHNRVKYSTVEAYALQSARQIQTAMMGRDESKRQRHIHIHHNSMAGSQSTNAYRAFYLDVGLDAGNTVEPQATTLVGSKRQGNVIAYADDSPPDIPGGYFLRDGMGFNAASNYGAYTTKTDCAWSHNALVGGTIPGGSLLAGDLSYANRAAAGIDAEHRLLAGSPLLTADIDGGPIGCHHALLDSALTGV